MMKNVQISQELFVALLHYHLSGENEYEEVIEQGLEQKLDAMLRHELYAQYKPAIEAEADEVRKAGGLFIIGTERHESHRGTARAGSAGVSGQTRRARKLPLVSSSIGRGQERVTLL